MLALRVMKMQIQLPRLLWICLTLRLMYPLVILNIKSTSVFFLLGKMIGMVRLLTSFILSIRSWEIGRHLKQFEVVQINVVQDSMAKLGYTFFECVKYTMHILLNTMTTNKITTTICCRVYYMYCLMVQMAISWTIVIIIVFFSSFFFKCFVFDLQPILKSTQVLCEKWNLIGQDDLLILEIKGNLEMTPANFNWIELLA